MSELGPLPEPAGMTELNPYADLGPLDPHRGKKVLTWYTADQMRAYAAAERAAERERWISVVDTLHGALKAAEARCNTLAERLHGGEYLNPHNTPPQAGD